MMNQAMTERVDMLEKWIQESNNVVFSAARAFLRKVESRIFAAWTDFTTKEYGLSAGDHHQP